MLIKWLVCCDRLERASEAMDDAEKALAIAPYSTKARIAKAEALYSMGQFEKVDKISILF